MLIKIVEQDRGLNLKFIYDIYLVNLLGGCYKFPDMLISELQTGVNPRAYRNIASIALGQPKHIYWQCVSSVTKIK